MDAQPHCCDISDSLDLVGLWVASCILWVIRYIYIYMIYIIYDIYIYMIYIYIYMYVSRKIKRR